MVFEKHSSISLFFRIFVIIPFYSKYNFKMVKITYIISKIILEHVFNNLKSISVVILPSLEI